MRSLQIRNLPDDVYEALAFRARCNHRSLAQQALVELRNVEEVRRREQRLEVVRVLRRQLAGGTRSLKREPEELVREDRER